MKKILALLLIAALAFSALSPAFAQEQPFADDAAVSVLTGSDFQDLGPKAYDRFGRMLQKMKNDGLPTPDSMLVGGDYTKLLFDYATPGVELIRENLTAVYPEADPDSVVCIQGNHDNPAAGLAATGFYDMGAYALYVINEDDFPWKQYLRPGVDRHIQKIAADLETHLNEMIETGDRRPVIVLTHLPLHHTVRANCGDNLYASYLFRVLNEAGGTLDVIFLFGHQHSGDFDDYIGGSVNFMAAGDTIRIPTPDRRGEDAYTEETLSFTYANCGYVGYSDNGVSETSTNVLTLGVIQFTEETFRFVKYTEQGLFRISEARRRNPASAVQSAARTETPARMSDLLWPYVRDFFARLFAALWPFRRLVSDC